MDAITYISNLYDFRIESETIFITKGTENEHSAAKYLSKDEEGNMLFNATKIPVHYKGNQSLCLVRVEELDLSDVVNMEVIGECINNEYVFVDGGQAKYESAYDTTTRMIDDGEGGSIEYTPPYKIGVFAG